MSGNFQGNGPDIDGLATTLRNLAPGSEQFTNGVATVLPAVTESLGMVTTINPTANQTTVVASGNTAVIGITDLLITMQSETVIVNKPAAAATVTMGAASGATTGAPTIAVGGLPYFQFSFTPTSGATGGTVATITFPAGFLPADMTGAAGSVLFHGTGANGAILTFGTFSWSAGAPNNLVIATTTAAGVGAIAAAVGSLVVCNADIVILRAS